MCVMYRKHQLLHGHMKELTDKAVPAGSMLLYATLINANVVCFFLVKDPDAYLLIFPLLLAVVMCMVAVKLMFDVLNTVTETSREFADSFQHTYPRILGKQFTKSCAIHRFTIGSLSRVTTETFTTVLMDIVVGKTIDILLILAWTTGSV